MIGGRSALLSAAGGDNPYGNWTGNYEDVSLLLRNGTPLLLPLDESPTPKTITTFGDASITTTVAKYGTSAMAFDGSGDYFETPATTAFDFGNSPFTIEAWINVSVLTSFAGVITVMNNLSGYFLDGYALSVDSNGSLGFQDCVNGLAEFSLSSAAGTITTGQWYHVAICKEGSSTNQVRLFVNGQIVASGTRNANIPVATTGQPARIGAWRFPTAPRFFNGYIDDLRVTTGFARYTSDFSSSLPAELPANATDDPHYSNVSLLLRNGTPLLLPLDESPTPKTITTFGDASMTTAVAKYGTSAMAFDGSGDYFTAPDSDDFYFDTDFTIECWVYLNVAGSSTQYIYAQWVDGGGSNRNVSLASNGVFYMNRSGANYTVSIGGISVGSWTHTAITLQGATLRGFKNGALVANSTVANAANNSTAPFGIGAYGNGSYPFNGYIDDLRITKSIARYTENFLPPPAELPAI